MSRFIYKFLLFLSPLALFFSSCLIIPLPATKVQGNVSVNSKTIQFLKPNITTREEVLLKLGDPDGVAFQHSILIYRWRVSHALVLSEGGADQIAQDRFFLVSFNTDHTVRKFEIINYNIDKRKKPLIDFLRTWEQGTGSR